jgi:hypothetical protein
MKSGLLISDMSNGVVITFETVTDSKLKSRGNSGVRVSMSVGDSTIKMLDAGMAGKRGLRVVG